MSAPDFLDTNVLLYAYDPTDARKQRIAQAIVERGLVGEVVLSAQVLAEFATALLHKASFAIRPDDVIGALDRLALIRVILPSHAVVRRAVEANQTYGIHFYDGMIVAAAEKAGCERIWSEDLNPGQKYFGVTVVNPFG